MTSSATRLLSYRIGLLDQMEQDGTPLEERMEALHLVERALEAKYREYLEDPAMAITVARRLGIGGAA
jgi:hypothetical protein